VRLGFMLWGLMAALALGAPHVAAAQCVQPSALRDGNFAEQRLDKALRPPWVAEGNAGFGNRAWAGRKTGWNALRQQLTLSAGVTYTLTATLRTSDDLRAGDGDVGFHDGRNPVAHKTFGPLKNFSDWSVRFTPNQRGPYKVYIGFVSRTDKSWILVERVRLEEPLKSGCPDVKLDPR
jgi:hypothetical protein